jgi:nicotinic acetylcholine receptor
VNLQWNPADYENIGDVRFSSGMVWKPDVLMYNSVGDTFDSAYPTNMVVYADGTVNWIPPGIFIVSCKIDVTWFPFDEQLCFFKFGSWTYDGTKIDLQTDETGLDLSEYLLNGEWDMYSEWPVRGARRHAAHHLESIAVRSEKFYDCCPEPYPDLRFMMYLRRRTLYYGVNLIIPCLIMTMMTITGFLLPSHLCQKVTFRKCAPCAHTREQCGKQRSHSVWQSPCSLTCSPA